MIDSEIMQNFIINHWNVKEKQMIENIKLEILNNSDKIKKSFINSLLEVFVKISQLQSEEKFGPLKYIDCSFLYTSFYINKPVYRIFAYDDKTILGDDLCTVDYKADWLYDHLIQISDKFIREKNNYNIMLTIPGLKILPTLSVPKINYLFYCVAKYWVREVVLSDEFKNIIKDEKVDIYLGEYDNKPFNIYRYSEKKEDINKKIRDIRNIESNKGLFCVFNDLKISDVDFSIIDFRFTRFKNCVFTSCLFKSNLLDDVEFDQCQFSNVIFDNCRMYGVTFSKSVLNECAFYEVNVGDNYIDKKLSDFIFKKVSFEKSVLKNIMFDNVNFADVLLTKSGFSGIYIQNSDFSNSDITNRDIVNLEIHNTQL